MKKVFTFFLLILGVTISFAQNPNFELLLKNDAQISSTEMQFDITIKPTGTTTTFELAQIQIVMNFNTAISSGTLTAAIIGGSSELVIAQQPTSASILVNQIIVPTKTPPGAGNGTIIDVEKRVARVKITSTIPFNVANANIVWKLETDPFTKVWAYIGGVNTEVTSSGTFSNELANSPLPVELSTFAAKIYGQDKVQLNWKTQTEVNNYGFEVERKVHTSTSLSVTAWEKVGFVNGNGNSNSPKEYSFVDKSPIGGSKFLYRLKQVDNDGQFEYSDAVEVELVPKEFALYQNYPNPFNPTTKINYSVPFDSKVTISIYSITGELVTELVNDNVEAGSYSANFNGINLASGIYFYRMAAGSFVKTYKMMLMK